MYSMGILVAYVSSIFGTFGIVLDHTFMFYDSAVMLPSFLMIGRYLEARAKKHTSDSIRELIGLQPTVATAIEIDENGEVVSQKEVSISDIVLDDLLLVKPGEKIPVDGEVIGGESYVDESMINGEPIPKVKKDGEPLIRMEYCILGLKKLEKTLFYLISSVWLKKHNLQDLRFRNLQIPLSLTSFQLSYQ